MRVAFVPDIHLPYHDKAAYDLVVRALKAWKPDVLVVMGDAVDMDSVSSFPKVDGRRMTLEEEMDAARPEFAKLNGIGATTKVYLKGNHEFRLERYLATEAQRLGKLVDLEGLLPLRGWRVIPYGQAYWIGELMMTHDIGRSGVNVARQQLQDAGENIVCGHSHRLQVVYGGQAHGPVHVSGSLGWLGDPDAITYRHRAMVQREWAHGFATAVFKPDTSGHFFLRVHAVVGGAVEIDGTIYT